MRSEKGRRTLICYAGSASEASIGSKPIGSELDMFIWFMRSKSQHFVDLSNARPASEVAASPRQNIENEYEKWPPVPCRGTTP